MPNLTDDQKILRRLLEPITLVLSNRNISDEEKVRQLVALIRNNPGIRRGIIKYEESFEFIPEHLVTSWVHEDPCESRRLRRTSLILPEIRNQQQVRQHSRQSTQRSLFLQSIEEVVQQMQQRTDRRPTREAEIQTDLSPEYNFSYSQSPRRRHIRMRILRPSERPTILRAQPPERFVPAEEHFILRRQNPAQNQSQPSNQLLIFPHEIPTQPRSLHLLPQRQPQRHHFEPLHLPNRPLVLARSDLEILSEIFGIVHDPEIAQNIKIEQITAMLRTSSVLWDMYRERVRMRLQRRSNQRTG